jgi:NAD(P)-dependent dehydrogenase (short-subunit alcohol dehydrogenase family)
MLGKNGVTANAICPGSVDTPMIDDIADQFIGKLGDRDSFDELVTSKSIQQRYLDPQEIASMVTFLASNGAKGITGQAINVCGGTVLS